MSASQDKILIVEDEADLCEILEERFKAEGFEVTIAKDGEQGLKLALSEKPDIILLDIIMPKLDGLAMLRQLRAHPEGKHTRVVVLTNVNETDEVHEALTLGARDFLVKSDWIIDDLVANVREQLNQPFTFG